MLNESLFKALNDQMNVEMDSAYLYLAMSAYAEDAGFKGVANWLYMQMREETAHAINMYQYILDRGSKPVLKTLAAPEPAYAGLKDVFEKTLAHEKMVSKRLNDIATLAMKENDHAAYQFIMWYVNEQVEEEASACDILVKLEMIGENKGLQLAMDKELATRTYINPFPDNPKLN